MNIANTIMSFGTLSLLNFGRKHAEKLGGNGAAEIAGLKDRVALAVTELEQAYQARRPLMALWNNAIRAKDAADDALDTAISALSYELLGPNYLKGDRNQAAYRALFPTGTIQFISGPDRAELAQVNAMVAYLKANATHPVADRATDLETKASALAACLEPAAAAETALRNARAIERDKRDTLVRTLRKSAAVLRAEFMDEKKVEALFPTVQESRVPEEDSTPAAAA